jgi:exodeoxyribonuclease VII small subunit
VAKKARNSDPTSDDPPTFEDELAALEAIVQQLEEGQVGLGESLKRYEQGVARLTRCYQLLERAEQKIELLLNVDENGNERAETFSEGAMSLEEKANRRGKRRSRRPSQSRREPSEAPADDVDAPGELF